MSTTPSELNAFRTKKTLTAFGHFDEPDCILLCEECEQNKAKIGCSICEQNQCENCDSTIHNKGKRAQHTRQLIKTESKRSLRGVFVSLDSFKEAKSFSATDQDVGIKFIDFIGSVLEINKISHEQSVVYVYYFSGVQLSQEVISKLCTYTEKLKYCFFIDVNRMQIYDEVKNVRFNKEAISVNDQKVVTLAKCLCAVSKGYQSVYIYDHNHSAQLGFLILAAENPEGAENQKVFVSESQANQLTGNIMKMEELTPKKSMQLMNIRVQTDRQGTGYLGDFKRSFTNESSGSELLSKLGINPSGFFFDDSQGGQQQKPFGKGMGIGGDFRGFQNEDASALKSFPRAYEPENSYEPNASLGDSNDKKRFNISEFNEQFYQNPLAPNVSNFTQESFPWMQGGNQQFKSPSNIRQTSPLVMIRQQLKELEVDGSLELGRYIQKELNRIALQGELVLLKEKFSELIDEAVTKKFNRKTPVVIEKANQVGIIHSTVRTFADGQTVTYVGLQLDIITVESLGWICRSIKRDAMAPTEKLVISRIKECFALKLSADTWKTLLNFLLEYQNSNKRLPVGDSEGILSFKITNIADPSTGADTHVIGIKGEEWSYDDIGTVDEASISWKTLMKFLDDFFDDEEEETGKSKTHKKEIATSNKQSHSEEKYEGFHKNDRAPNQMPEGRAIPGGRYGCAQFIKACGPEALRNESLGRLNLYVQEAINRGILRYQRTLLVKNTQSGILEGKLESLENQGESNPTLMRQLQQLNKIKAALIEVLAENPNGLSLAQIPQYLRRKLSFSFNLQDMGFPKLKNLLNTMTDDIKIELSGTNHSYASLKNPEKYAHLVRRRGPKNYYSHLHEEDPSILFGYSVKSNLPPTTNYQDSEAGAYVQNPSTHSKLYVKKYHTFTPDTQTAKSTKVEYKKKFNSSYQDYLQRFRTYLEKTMKEYPTGIDIDQLYARLSRDLGGNFDFMLFECRSFYEFLVSYADESVEVQTKKSTGAQKPSYVVFQKHYRFTPTYPVQEQNQERYFFQQQQQSTPVKNTKPPLYSGTASYFYGGGNYQSQNSPDYRGGLNTVLFNQQSPLFQINTNVSTSKSTESKERQYFSPVIQVTESPTHIRNESYLKSTFGTFESTNSGIETPQSDLRGTRLQKEPSSEGTDDNFKFIDDLLKDNSNPKNKTGPQEISPNISTTSSTWDKSLTYSKTSHTKAPSNDLYSGTQFTIRYPPGLKIEGRSNNDYDDRQSGRFIGSQNSM